MDINILVSRYSPSSRKGKSAGLWVIKAYCVADECSFVRRLISGGGNIFARFMLGIPVHDCTGGFRCYRRKVLQSIDLDAIQSRGYAFQVELTYRVMKQGFKIVETPITSMDPRPGKSKMSRKIVIEAFTYVLRTRFRVLPSLEQPGQVQGQRDFGQPRSGNDEGSHYAHPSLTA